MFVDYVFAPLIIFGWLLFYFTTLYQLLTSVYGGMIVNSEP
jgi:hypothetical protein